MGGHKRAPEINIAFWKYEPLCENCRLGKFLPPFAHVETWIFFYVLANRMTPHGVLLIAFWKYALLCGNCRLGKFLPPRAHVETWLFCYVLANRTTPDGVLGGIALCCFFRVGLNL